jgi:hypothetical protein
MKNFLRLVIVALIGVSSLLIFGCSLLNEADPNLANEDVTVLDEGTSTEKVDAYIEKAEEAKLKLEKLMEGEEEEDENLSFFPTAQASGFIQIGDISGDGEARPTEEITNLLAEIQLYIELAAEAVEEENDPVTAAALLEIIQGAQADTGVLLNEILENVEGEVQDEFVEISADVEEVGELLAEAVEEVAEAVSEGAETVALEIETSVGDFVYNGARRIRLKDFQNQEVRIKKKIGHEEHKLTQLKRKLINKEVPQEEADEMIAKYEGHIENLKAYQEQKKEDGLALKEARESGDKEAIAEVREGIKEHKTEHQIDRREHRNGVFMKRIENMTEEEQEELEEKMEEKKEERQEVREEVREDKDSLKEAIQSGDKEAVKEVKEEIKEHREEYREERKENAPSPEEIQKRRMMLQKQINPKKPELY